MPEAHTIQSVSQQTGLGIDTLRYYEKLGIITPVRRTPGGHRQYSGDDLRWIGFVQNLLATGMSLATVQTYMALVRQGEATAAQRIALLEAHTQVLEGQIAALHAALATARNKIAHHAELRAAWSSEEDPRVDGREKPSPRRVDPS